MQVSDYGNSFSLPLKSTVFRDSFLLYLLPFLESWHNNPPTPRVAVDSTSSLFFLPFIFSFLDVHAYFLFSRVSGRTSPPRGTLRFVPPRFYLGFSHWSTPGEKEEPPRGEGFSFFTLLVLWEDAPPLCPLPFRGPKTLYPVVLLLMER